MKDLNIMNGLIVIPAYYPDKKIGGPISGCRSFAKAVALNHNLEIMNKVTIDKKELKKLSIAILFLFLVITFITSLFYIRNQNSIDEELIMFGNSLRQQLDIPIAEYDDAESRFYRFVMPSHKNKGVQDREYQ